MTLDVDHPAPFTAWIAQAQILTYSPPGGIVCDPFVGSGTTAIVAAQYGRSFVGGDLGARERDGARWADVARERAMSAAGQALRQPEVRREQADAAKSDVAEQMPLLIA